MASVIKETTGPVLTNGYVDVMHFERFTIAIRTCSTVNICVTDDHGCVPFVVVTIRLSRLIIGFWTTVTGRIPILLKRISYPSGATEFAPVAHGDGGTHSVY